MRGGPDGLAEVRLADSALRSGEPITWGSGQQKLNRSWETWAPYNGGIRSSMQREELPVMETGLERIAVKARSEPKFRFTSLAHHITRERVWKNLNQIPNNSAPGSDGQTVLEDGKIHPNKEGTPQGGSISVLLSNPYLHYVLDLWFEHAVKPRLRGEAYLVRYIDDFVVCFQYRSDALRFQNVLRKRLGKFALALEPKKTKLVEFGRFAQRHAGKRGRMRPETICFLGFTLYCTHNRKGNFKVGLRTEKSRLRRGLSHLSELMRRTRHLEVQEQVFILNRVLRGHYAYYGIAGNLRALQKVHRFVERYWRKMLCSRSRKGYIPWDVCQRIKERFPLQRPGLVIPYRELPSLAVL